MDPVGGWSVINYMDVVDSKEKMPNGALPGPDGVPMCLLNEGLVSIALMLMNIFKLSFKMEDIPDILKLGLVEACGISKKY